MPHARAERLPGWATRELVVEPCLLIGCPDVAQRQLQELGLGVPVPCDRGPVHGQDAKGVEIVHEHRLGVGLEQEPVLALAFE